MRREKILAKLKQHAPELIATGVVAIGVGLYIKSRRTAAGLNWTEAITSESPDPETGIMIPWSVLHRLAEKGPAAKFLMTVTENADDLTDNEFVLSFLGTVPAGSI